MENETLNLTDAQVRENEKLVSNLYANKRQLYEKANETVNRLGLGGLWRGRDAAVLIVAKAIREASIYSESVKCETCGAEKEGTRADTHLEGCPEVALELSKMDALLLKIPVSQRNYKDPAVRALYGKNAGVALV